MGYRKPVLWITALLGVFTAAILVAQPLLVKSILAKYKSTDHFLVLEEDSRIQYEEAAIDDAIAVAAILGERKEAVERVLHARFEAPIQIFVCASQESFNRYVYLSANARGATYWGKIFLSPGAFDRGSLPRLVAHELTHYLFYSHLGDRRHVANVPLWFREGIATYVASGGPNYSAGRELRALVRPQERQAVLSGDADYWFGTEDPRDAVTVSGVADGFLYKVGALFIHYLQESDPERFDALVQLLLSGEDFNSAFLSSFDRSQETMLLQFKDHLSE